MIAQPVEKAFQKKFELPRFTLLRVINTRQHLFAVAAQKPLMQPSREKMV